MNRPSSTARLLFIIDNDFGALGVVMHLLYRQPLARQSTLLLPRHAYELHQDQLFVPSCPYDSLQDILDCVEQESPDIIYLFSGYLLAGQGLLSISALRKLIRLLRERGCKLATSDPYLGTFLQISEAPARAGAFRQKLMRQLLKLPPLYKIAQILLTYVQKKMLRSHIGRVADSLSTVTHICVVPADRLPAGGAHYLSFFNPAYIRSAEELRSISASVSVFPDISSHRQRWLFVLASFDLEYQEQQYGKQGFVDIVVSKLRETLDNNKHPTLIAPAGFIAEVSRHFKPGSGVSLLSFCAFAEFELRLLDAEIVFYWQIFSTSTFLRLVNGLPVFFFDQGHTARLLQPLYEAGLRSYYIADPPIYLDVEIPLDAASLAKLSTRFERSAQESCEYLTGSLTLGELVDNLLNSA